MLEKLFGWGQRKKQSDAFLKGTSVAEQHFMSEIVSRLPDLAEDYWKEAMMYSLNIEKSPDSYTEKEHERKQQLCLESITIFRWITKLLHGKGGFSIEGLQSGIERHYAEHRRSAGEESQELLPLEHIMTAFSRAEEEEFTPHIIRFVDEFKVRWDADMANDLSSFMNGRTLSRKRSLEVQETRGYVEGLIHASCDFLFALGCDATMLTSNLPTHQQ